MARPMGAVRLKKTNPLTLLVGAAVCAFIFVFLFFSSSDRPTVRSGTTAAAAHHLSPPTSPYRKPPPSSLSSKRLQPPPVVRYNLNNVTITSDPVANREPVLILTPMARFYPEYWENLLRLTYPHDLITLGFILPKTKEGNSATVALQQYISHTQNRGPEKDRFRSIIILRQDFDPAVVSQDESVRHKRENQKARRAVMSRARNSLLFTTLGPSTSWVLWLDADIVESPPSLVQDLASHDRDIIAANCFQRYFDQDSRQPSERPYDFNNWQDSEIAQGMAMKMGPDEIILEGYRDLATYRPLMAFLTTDGGDPHTEVLLDGVGGTALLVKADVHRDGAMFPPFSFYHLIETEGFAKMAKRLGKQPYGLPNYKVYHFNE